MKNNQLITFDEVSKKILNGENLFIAGDESLLQKLPKGNWVGGTIPYFMSGDGGVITKDKIFVTTLPEYVEKVEAKFHNSSSLKGVYQETPSDGFSFIILPASTKIHLDFAVDGPNYPGFASKPLIGWIAGVHLNDLGKIQPKVFNGFSGQSKADEAVVMTVKLKSGYVCDMGIINIFKQGEGDTIEFNQSGFSIKEAIVNGQKVDFAKYCVENKIDVKRPLVANYAGVMINVSFQNIDTDGGKVDLYAPVFSGVKYKQAAPVGNYVQDFTKNIPSNSDDIAFSCNCILNFLYSELENKKTGQIVGPITFGEVAYQLLNQTMVYLSVIKL